MRKTGYVLIVFLLTIMPLQASEFGLDLTLSEMMSGGDVYWPIHSFHEHAKVNGHAGLLWLDGLTGLHISIGYSHTIYRGEILRVEVEGLGGCMFGGYSNRIGEGIMGGARSRLLFNWLLPFEYGVTYQYYVYMLSNKEDKELSNQQGGVSFFVRIPIDKSLIFPDRSPYMEPEGKRYQID